MKKPWLCLRKITFPFQLSILWNWQTCNLPTRLGMSKIRESGPETATVLLHTLEAESSRAHQNHPKHRIAGRMSLLENMSIKIIFKPSTKQSKRIYKRPYWVLIQSHQNQANKLGRKQASAPWRFLEQTWLPAHAALALVCMLFSNNAGLAHSTQVA